jgi:hypothetical protein
MFMQSANGQQFTVIVTQNCVVTAINLTLKKTFCNIQKDIRMTEEGTFKYYEYYSVHI